MKITKQHWMIIGGASVVGLGIGSYFLFFNKKKPERDSYGNMKISRKTSGGISGGIQTSSHRKGTALTEPNWNRPFNQKYAKDVMNYLAPKQIHQLDYAVALKYADILKKANGGWFGDDNEQDVVTIFGKKLKDKVQVANLAKVFYDKHKKDMWEHLKSFLSTSEMEKYVSKPVRKLPNYRVK